MSAVAQETPFDWKNPDYAPIVHERALQIKRLRENPRLLAPLREFYRSPPWQFVSDRGLAFDPRNAERGLPNTLRFVLMPDLLTFADNVNASWIHSDYQAFNRDDRLRWNQIFYK